MQHSILRSYIQHLLVEGKIDDLKEKNQEIASEIDRLGAEVHPKYLEWAVKQLKLGVSPNDLIPTLQAFDKNAFKYKSKDINSYKTLKQLEDETKEILNLKSKTQDKKEV